MRCPQCLAPMKPLPNGDSQCTRESCAVVQHHKREADTACVTRGLRELLGNYFTKDATPPAFRKLAQVKHD